MSPEEIKQELDKLLVSTYREQDDKTQVLKIELYVCKEESQAAQSLKPLYMKTNESPYIFDYDDCANKITIYYIPAMKVLYKMRQLLLEYPENDTML